MIFGNLIVIRMNLVFDYGKLRETSDSDNNIYSTKCILVRTKNDGLNFSLFYFLFSFLFSFLFYISIFRTQGQSQSHNTEERHRRFLKDMMLYNMYHTWLFKVGQKYITRTIYLQYIRQTIMYRVLYQVLLYLTQIQDFSSLTNFEL